MHIFHIDGFVEAIKIHFWVGLEFGLLGGLVLLFSPLNEVITPVLQQPYICEGIQGSHTLILINIVGEIRCFVIDE